MKLAKRFGKMKGHKRREPDREGGESARFKKTEKARITPPGERKKKRAAIAAARLGY